MYDKTVRRRRAVLGLLVACSLILLTAYFGESGSGALHSVQRGTSEVLNPVQEGASRALKPVRDLFGWFGDTIAAKGQVEDLRRERDRLRTRGGQQRGQQRRLRPPQQALRSSTARSASRTSGRRPAASSSSRRPSGTRRSASTRAPTTACEVGHPVINEEALIGRVTEVFGGSAQVTLITDTTTKVPARAGPRARSSASSSPPAPATRPTSS